MLFTVSSVVISTLGLAVVVDKAVDSLFMAMGKARKVGR